ncbi:hypothetical protein UF75_1806 [Desulfosporosinus sp. I2]|nr:hypothetical protein UF75_1806 [Desulfosporosinus sp. I2]
MLWNWSVSCSMSAILTPFCHLYYNETAGVLSIFNRIMAKKGKLTA